MSEDHSNKDSSQSLSKLVAKGVRPKILVADDEQSIREFLQIMLKREKIDVTTVPNGLEAWKKLQEEAFDLVISDLKMPEMTGMELLQKIMQKDPQALVLMITAFGSTESAVEAMKLGAYDYLSKPFKIDDVKLRIAKALEKRTLVADNARLRKELGERFSFSNIIGNSDSMKGIFELIKRVSSTDSNVLVSGESGTGKELIARALHFNSPVSTGPFVTMNCGAISEQLMESEMFGHKKGAFTGAIADKKGFFEMAHGGTLFLDEVGEMPPAMQAALLRAIQEGIFYPVGATEPVEAKVRLIAATNRDLEEEVSKGNFREDLFFRLNVIHIKVAPLRKRKEDIPYLVDFFVEKYSEKFGKSVKTIPRETMQLLMEYRWPGNVRELENVVERMVALESGAALMPESLPSEISEPLKPKLENLAAQLTWNAAGVSLEDVLSSVEREFVLKALEQSKGVKKDAAKLLSITMRSLRYRLEKLGVQSSDDDET